MPTCRRIASALALTLALAGTSHAAKLYAAPATAPYVIWDPETTYCTVLNTKTTPLTLTISTHDHNGKVLAKTAPLVLQPEAGTSVAMGAGGTYCEFDVDGSAKSVRAMAVSQNSATKHYTIAVPAQ